MRDMMNPEIFFCDTYALVEIALGNTRYTKYITYVLVTSEQNIMELYYAFLRDYDQQKAEKHFQFWSYFIVHIPQQTIKNAMKFKLANKKDKLSYVDCIGYIFSQENEMKFLTGDQKFENKIGVEFVK